MSIPEDQLPGSPVHRVECDECHRTWSHTWYASGIDLTADEGFKVYCDKCVPSTLRLECEIKADRRRIR